MHINVTYDSSAAGAPAGFQQAVQAAVQFYEATVANDITINIQFGWGQIDGQPLDVDALGESKSGGGYLFNYDQLTSALVNQASSVDNLSALAGLPDADPTHGGQFFVTGAQAKALGLLSPTDATLDGYVSLDATAPYTFDPAARAVSGVYDAIGALEHEIGHVLGRIAGMGDTTSDGAPVYTLLDLFRYAGAGVATPGSSGGSFSLDGQHLLLPFNDPTNGGDPGDWGSGAGADSYSAFATPGVQLAVSSGDLKLLEAIGYHLGHAVPVTPDPGYAPPYVIYTELTAPYTVAQGQTVYVTTTDPNGANSDFAGFIIHNGAFTNAGRIIVLASHGGDDAAAISGQNSSAPVVNTATGSIYMTSGAAGQLTYGLQWVKSVDNAGLIQSVSTAGGATGVKLANSGSVVNRAGGVISAFGAQTAVPLSSQIAQVSAVGVEFNWDGSLNNAGLIEAIGSHAVGVRGATSFTNSGVISAISLSDPSVAVSIYSLGFPSTADETFTNSGTIQGDYAFYASGTHARTLTLNNSGQVVGAVYFGDSNTIINNTGSMAGNIVFGASQNTYGGGGHFYGAFYLNGGTSTITLGAEGSTVYGIGGAGTITGGAGNDVFELSRGAFTFNGGGGFNILSFANSVAGVTVDLSTGSVFAAGGFSTVSSVQEVIGSAYGDTLRAGSTSAILVSGSGLSSLTGGASGDTLVAGTGGGTMTGGGGADIFAYSIGDHQWTITDFRSSGADVLYIYGYTAAQSVTQVGSDVRITLSGTDSILVRNVQVSALTGGALVYHADPMIDPPAPLTSSSFGDQTVFVYSDMTIGAGEHINNTSSSAAFVTAGHGLVMNGQVSLAYDIYDTIYGVALSNYDQFGNQFTTSAQTDYRVTLGSGSHMSVTNALGSAVLFGYVGNYNINAGASSATGAVRAWGAQNTTVNYTFDNQATGVLTISGGIYAVGIDVTNGGYLSNEGQISVSASQAYGVHMNTGLYYNYFQNSGTVTATSTGSSADAPMSVGVWFGGLRPGSVQNSGTIIAQTAVLVDQSSGYTPKVSVSNTGRIVGDIVLGHFGGSISNAGSITGDIHLPDAGSNYIGVGYDYQNQPITYSYSGAAGTLTGSIYLGVATNTVILGNDGGRVYGAATGGTNTVTGGTGNDIIQLGGAGVTNAGSGSDTLTGGGGADKFVFTAGFSGQTTITDFSHADGDRLDFSALGGGVHSLASLATHAVQVGADVRITLGSGVVTLSNVNFSSLTAGDFVFGANTGPSISIANQRLGFGAGVSLASLLHYSDAEGDPLVSYRIWDLGTDANSGYFSDSNSAHELASASVYFTVAAANISSLVLHGGSVAGTETMVIQAFDGLDWGASFAFTLTTGNRAPTTNLANQTLAAGATVNLASLINFADADGDAAVSYRFWDDGAAATSGYFSDSNSAHEASGAAFTVAAADIGSVVLHGGSAAGVEGMWVQAFDGTDWSPWQRFTLTTTAPANRAPTTNLADQRLAAGATVNLAGLIGYADADGNPAVSYRFWDDGAGASTGYISDTANAHEAAGAAFTVAASDIANAVLHAGSAAGVEGMWVQAFDGTDWSPWQHFTLTTTGVNHAPTTSLADQTLAAGATVNLAGLIGYVDADNDAAVSYRFWDDGGGTTTGYISDTANAHEASGAAFTIAASDIGNAVLHAGSAAGAEVMWVQAFDGTAWSNWQSFTLTTTGVNRAPTTSLADQTLAAGGSVNLAGLIGYADADNDAAVSYRFWDDGGGATTGYISDTANAHEASGAAFTIAASDIGNAVLHAGSAAGAEGMWVQAFDGTDWSPWQRFTLTTTGVNHAPTTSLADQTLAVGGSVNLAGLIGYADADNDAAVSYRFWDDGGGATTGYISDTANAHEASGAAFTIAASDIGNAVLHAGSAAGAEGMWVQAFDGTAWSPWQRFTLTTTGVNHAPTVSIANHTVAANSATALSSWLTYADADNDAATQYQLWDDGSAASSGYFSDTANAHEAAGATITVAASDFANIMVHGGGAAGGDTLWVRAFDGHDWSNWAQFQLLTA